MGFSLKSIGKTLLHVGVPLAASLVGGPALGALVGAGVGAIGNGKPKIGSILAGGATGALGGSALKSIGSLAGGLGGAGAAAGAAGETAGLGGGLGGTLGAISSIGGGLLKNAPLILGGLGAISSAKDGAHANSLADEALAIARARDAELAPLRTAGIGAALDRFQHPVTPFDAVGGYVDAGNPYSATPRGAPAPAVAAPGTSAAMPRLSGVTPLRRTALRRLA